MSDDKEPKIVLCTPANLKPEDLDVIMPFGNPEPEGYEFLGHEVRFFSNEYYTGFEVKWGCRGIGFGSVTWTVAMQDHERTDEPGVYWARKGAMKFDDENMSEEFVEALIKHAALDITKALFKIQEVK